MAVHRMHTTKEKGSCQIGRGRALCSPALAGKRQELLPIAPLGFVLIFWKISANATRSDIR